MEFFHSNINYYNVEFIIVHNSIKYGRILLTFLTSYFHLNPNIFSENWKRDLAFTFLSCMNYSTRNSMAYLLVEIVDITLWCSCLSMTISFYAAWFRNTSCCIMIPWIYPIWDIVKSAAFQIYLESVNCFLYGTIYIIIWIFGFDSFFIVFL